MIAPTTITTKDLRSSFTRGGGFLTGGMESPPIGAPMLEYGQIWTLVRLTKSETECCLSNVLERFERTECVSLQHRERVMVRPDLPIPKGICHVGLTVPDAEAAADFLVAALGCERLFSMDDIELNKESAANLDVDAGARIEKLMLLRLPHGPGFELFQYAAPDQSASRPRNSDLAGHHVAFLVEDLERVAERVERAGGRLCGSVTHSKDSPFGGVKWLYFVTPWGLHMELWEPPPEGIDFERQTGRAVHEL
jgi:catechol 2,3-dioxygenase-like lactoylglutathione lyase family enzyme